MNVRAKFVSVLICVLAPVTAFANAGTPLVWVSGFHLLVGNILIGLGEAWVLQRWFAAEKTLSRCWLVPANYFSMISGMIALAIIEESTGLHDALLGGNPLQRGFAFVVLSYVAIYVATVILEWPFVFLALPGQPHRWQRSIRASMVVQGCSYACLLPIYVLTSDVSLFTRTQITPPQRFAKNPNAWVYSISPKDGDVYRVRLNGTQASRVKKAGIRHKGARLFPWRTDDSKHYALWLIQDRQSKKVQVLADIGNRVSVWQKHEVDLNYIPDTWRNRGPFAADLRPEAERDWRVSGWDGLWVHRGGKPQYWLGLEAPFLNWPFRNLILLPGDQLVFQLGDQIVLLDLNTRQIGLITLGRGPVVVLEDPR